jgi:hypothetical protein
MKASKLLFIAVPSCMALFAVGQQPGPPHPMMKPQVSPLGAGTASGPPRPPAVPKVATTIPAKGIHLTTAIGSFKIKRGSEANNFGLLQMTFKGTVLVSGLKGVVTVGGGTALEFEQTDFNKKVYFSKGGGTLTVKGEFGGVQFFGQDLSAYYRGDGVLQLFGEFDKNLNTGFYWYDETPSDKKYWNTTGQQVTPTPFQSGDMESHIKVKNVTGKG